MDAGTFPVTVRSRPVTVSVSVDLFTFGRAAKFPRHRNSIRIVMKAITSGIRATMARFARNQRLVIDNVGKRIAGSEMICSLRRIAFARAFNSNNVRYAGSRRFIGFLSVIATTSGRS
jgi:hypothetical protein